MTKSKCLYCTKGMYTTVARYGDQPLKAINITWLCTCTTDFGVRIVYTQVKFFVSMSPVWYGCLTNLATMPHKPIAYLTRMETRILQELFVNEFYSHKAAVLLNVSEGWQTRLEELMKYSEFLHLSLKINSKLFIHCTTLVTLYHDTMMLNHIWYCWDEKHNCTIPRRSTYEKYISPCRDSQRKNP